MAEQPKELIYKKIPTIMAEIKAISKTRENTSQQYKFRSIDDVYNEFHDVLAKNKVFTVPEVLRERHEERKSQKGNVLIYRIFTVKYTFFAEDGSHIEATVVGEGMDTGDKAGNKALSGAHKYALLQVFCVPTEDAKDSDVESHKLTGEPSEPKTYSKKQDKASQEIADIASGEKPEYPKDITLTKTDGARVKVDKYGALAKFQAIKKAIGDDAYYKILGEHGHEKSNEIAKKDIPKIYAQMVEAYAG